MRPAEKQPRNLVVLADYVPTGTRCALTVLAHETARVYRFPVGDNVTFGALLRQLRERRDLSLREAARQASVSPTYWSRLEKDDLAFKGPAVLKIIDIAGTLRATPHETERLFELAGHGDFWSSVKNYSLLATTAGAGPALEWAIEFDQTLDSKAKQRLQGALESERARMHLEKQDPSYAPKPTPVTHVLLPSAFRPEDDEAEATSE